MRKGLRTETLYRRENLGVEVVHAAVCGAEDGLTFGGEKQHSTSFVQDAWVTMKRTWIRGLAASQVWTFGCLCAASSIIRCKRAPSLVSG